MDRSGLNVLAVNATLHCLTGCAIGEISGLILGSAANWSNSTTVIISILLAFVFGYGLSIAPLVHGGVGLKRALLTALAADTLSITTMEIVDNGVELLIPGAMNATLLQPIFWLSMVLSLMLAYAAAFPVNRALLRRGKGHALAHEQLHGSEHTAPSGGMAMSPLLYVLIGFTLGGLLVAIAATTFHKPPL